MRISEINIYPIKSLGGISLKESIVEKRGLKNDRRFMLVDDKESFFTQREYPQMSTISVSLTDNGLEVLAAGFDKQSIDFQDQTNEKINVQVWRDTCEAFVFQKHINDWFSEVLGLDCRLVYMPDETERKLNPIFNQNNDIVSFADGYPLLLIGEKSLNDLNSKLPEKIPMNRFRPNIVISGSEAFAEDGFKKIKIGETVFRITKPCARCVVTTIDQTNGVPTGKEPLKTLADYRKAKDVYPDEFESLGLDKNAVLFGQNLVPENVGEVIKIGDSFEV